MTRGKATVLCGSMIFVVSVFCALSFGSWEAVSGFELFAKKQGVFSTLDHLASNWLLPVGGFFITLVAGWIMTKGATRAELADETAPTWFRYDMWSLFIRYIAPLAVAAIIVAVLAGKDFS